MNFTAHNVVSLFRRPQPRDWDNAELAQFYRVESALRQAGIFVDTDRGMTDEGDPWFVYCRQDTDDVFLHIARFDGVYMAASPSMGAPLLRKKFEELLDELVRDNPVMLPPSRSRRPGPDLYIHPSTMLIAAVAALFYKSAPIRTEDHGENPLRQAELRSGTGFGGLSDVYSVALVSAMAIIAVLHHSVMDDRGLEDRHPEELAFLDGLLLDGGAGRQDLPSFEGNVVPSGVMASVSAETVEVVVAEHIVTEAGFNTAFALQSLFGKFAETIVAASATVASSSVEAVMSRHPADPESQPVRGEAPVGDGGEKALAGNAASNPAFVLAAASPDFKSQDENVQQVSLAPAETKASQEQAVVQLASVAGVSTVTDMFTPLSQGKSGQGDQPSSPAGGVDDIADGGVGAELPTVEPSVPGGGEGVVVETPAPAFYDVVVAGGMLVLLSPSDEAKIAATDSGDLTAALPIDASIVGVSPAVDMLAVA